MRKLLSVLILCVLTVVAAAAQETRGTISGTVNDAQGVVPGATVRITNTDTNTSQVLVTNNTGYRDGFTFDHRFTDPFASLSFADLQRGAAGLCVEIANSSTALLDVR